MVVGGIAQWLECRSWPELSLSCARLKDGRVNTLWVNRLLSVSQQSQLSLPSLQGQLNK